MNLTEKWMMYLRHLVPPMGIDLHQQRSQESDVPFISSQPHCQHIKIHDFECLSVNGTLSNNLTLMSLGPQQRNHI